MKQVGDILPRSETINVHLQILGHGGNVVLVVLMPFEIGMMREEMNEAHEGLLEGTLAKLCRSAGAARGVSERAHAKLENAEDDSPGTDRFALLLM